jgi:glycosyltransferase involved in cell wall biosynthesis
VCVLEINNREVTVVTTYAELNAAITAANNAAPNSGTYEIDIGANIYDPATPTINLPSGVTLDIVGNGYNMTLFPFVLAFGATTISDPGGDVELDITLTTLGTAGIALNAGSQLWANGFPGSVALTTGSGNIVENSAATIQASSLTIQTGGVATLGAANSITGGVTIAAGTVDLTASGAAGTGAIRLQSGTLEFTPGTAPTNAITGFGSGDNIQIDGFTEQSGTYFNNILTLQGLDASDHATTVTLNVQGLQASNFQVAVASGVTTISYGTNQTDIVPCYCAGTRIATERGEVVVEELAIGDRALTRDGELRPIKWIGRRSYRQPFIAHSVLPILIKACALRENVPSRDLYVSPEHAMYIDDVLVRAECLVNGVSVVRCAEVATVEYFHIELDSHDVIFAEGAPAETFVVCGNRLMFHNAAEFAELYPCDGSPGWAFCAPRVDCGPVLEQIQQVIAQRAGLASLDDAAACGPLEGHFDDASHTLINGWAWDPSQPHARVWLEVLVNDGVIGRVLADKYRPDLAQSGVSDGYQGFALWLQQGLSPLARHVIRVRRAADGCELPGSPRVIEARDAPDFLRSTDLVPALRTAALGAANDEALDQLLNSLRRGINEVRQVRAERGETNVEIDASTRLLRRAKRGATKARRALVIDDGLPDAARDAGSNAVLGHMRVLQALGYRVEFVPARQNGTEAMPSDHGLGEIRWHRAPAVTSVEDVLRRHADGYELIYLHRLSNAMAYAGLARQWCAQAQIVCSVADLHHLRLARQAELQDLPHLLARAESMKRSELHAMRGVDAVITHSRAEADYLAAQAPDVRTHVVPWPLVPLACNTSFAARAGLAFIGSVGHDPNIDAVAWLIQEIMPRVWRRDPSMTCRIVGAGWSDVVRGSVDRRVRLTGAVPELATLFDQVRLTVAPLRFGAGIKGKVLESLAAGVPCVMTPMAAEGLALEPPLRALVGQDPDQLANLIWRTHKDVGFNTKAAVTGLDLIRRDFGAEQVRSALQAALTRTELGIPLQRRTGGVKAVA